MRTEVTEMLTSDEYAAIKADYDAISRAHFAQSYIPPAACVSPRARRCSRPTP
jgi:hypothetical protein